MIKFTQSIRCNRVMLALHIILYCCEVKFETCCCVCQNLVTTKFLLQFTNDGLHISAVDCFDDDFHSCSIQILTCEATVGRCSNTCMQRWCVFVSEISYSAGLMMIRNNSVCVRVWFVLVKLHSSHISCCPLLTSYSVSFITCLVWHREQGVGVLLRSVTDVRSYCYLLSLLVIILEVFAKVSMW